jgi:hypothetical protein
MRRHVLVLALTAATAGCSGLSIRSPISTAPTAGGPPSTFVITTSDARVARTIDVQTGMTRAAAFRAVSDYLNQKYSVDVSDSRAGFLMTPWQASLVRSGAPDPRYRTRVIVRLSDDGKQATVRSEANWQRGGDEWDVGYDSQMLEDVVVDLRTRVGKKPS